MWVIAKRTLREFWELHPQAKEPLEDWYRLMDNSNFQNFNELRQVFGSADYAAPLTIFDIGGNKYRLAVGISYEQQRVYIKRVMTHSEYDRWNKEGRPL